MTAIQQNTNMAETSQSTVPTFKLVLGTRSESLIHSQRAYGLRLIWLPYMLWSCIRLTFWNLFMTRRGGALWSLLTASWRWWYWKDHIREGRHRPTRSDAIIADQSPFSVIWRESSRRSTLVRTHWKHDNSFHTCYDYPTRMYSHVLQQRLVLRCTLSRSPPTTGRSASMSGIQLDKKSSVASATATTFKGSVVLSCSTWPQGSRTKTSRTGIVISSVFVKTSRSCCAVTRLM